MGREVKTQVRERLLNCLCRPWTEADLETRRVAPAFGHPSTCRRRGQARRRAVPVLQIACSRTNLQTTLVDGVRGHVASIRATGRAITPSSTPSNGDTEPVEAIGFVRCNAESDCKIEMSSVGRIGFSSGVASHPVHSVWTARMPPKKTDH